MRASSDPQQEIIRASEIGQHAYCARAWWYARVQGHVPENVVELERGVAEHREHGRVVESYRLQRWVAVGVLLLAAVLMVVWIVVSQGA